MKGDVHMRIVRDLFALLRIDHWTKNIFIFAALLFSQKLYERQPLLISVTAFFAFCFVASSIYIINDIHDAHLDRLHPKKSCRPIAAGRVSRALALVTAAIFFTGGMVIGAMVQPSFFTILLSYFVLNLFYTYMGKKLVIIDAFCIAAGFVLRVVGGALAISVQPSGWIMMTTFFLALFLGFGKRRNEMLAPSETESLQRKTPIRYDAEYANHILISCGTISLLSYALYTRDPSVIQRIGTPTLIYTVPLVAYGFFRYVYLLWNGSNGDPTDLILHDWSMLIDITLWVVAVVLLIYI
ncbi:MAG: hypothetical protein AMS17_16135 [Spirochaetes bacterium DG_61]|nr:MAG: hypothetical protein AMS17_16135 [Spirochaetes bacterium DG_61]